MDFMDAQHQTAPARTCSAVEEFVARGHLRVGGILHLHQLVLVPPAWYRPLASFAAIPSRSCARDLEEVTPADLNVAHGQQPHRH
jgi:hypothetical protein